MKRYHILRSLTLMNSSEDKRSFKRKKPFVNNGFRKPMQQEPRSRISHPQPPSAAKRPNNNSDRNPARQTRRRKTLTSTHPYRGWPHVCASGYPFLVFYFILKNKRKMLSKTYNN